MGDSFLLVARVHESNGSHLPSRPVEWSSDTPGVLRVNATKAVATAVAPGSALITATCDGNQGRLRVTVAPPRADAILVKAPDKPISVGDEVRLEAVPRDKRGRVVTRPVTWKSDNDSVATISLEGVLVARSGGSTRISAELDEARAKVTVTIMPAPVAALHISPPPELVTPGDSFALNATPLDRWAGALSDRIVSWSTSDVRVAVVTAGGWVMTRNPGMVMLSATCEGVSASVSFNVVTREAAQAAAAPVHPHHSSGPWDLDVPAEVPEPARSRPRWLVAAGGLGLMLAALWLAGGRRMITPADPSESAAATADSAKDPPAAAAATDSASSSVIITRRPARPLTPGACYPSAGRGAGPARPGGSRRLRSAGSRPTRRLPLSIRPAEPSRRWDPDGPRSLRWYPAARATVRESWYARGPERSRRPRSRPPRCPFHRMSRCRSATPSRSPRRRWIREGGGSGPPGSAGARASPRWPMWMPLPGECGLTRREPR